MKKRWMKSVIEASKAEAPRLPFQRGNRSAREVARTPKIVARRTA